MNRSALEKFASFSMQPSTNAPFSFRFSIWMNSKLPFIPIETQLITQSILIKNGNKIKSPPPSGVAMCGIYKMQKGTLISVVVRHLKQSFIRCFCPSQIKWYSSCRQDCHLIRVCYTGFALLSRFSDVLQKNKFFRYNVFRVPVLPQITPCPKKGISVFKSFAHYGEINKCVTGKKSNRYFTGQPGSLQSIHKFVQPLRALSSWISFKQAQV